MNNSFLSHADAALRNRNNVLHYVRYHDNISRTDVYEDMNMSRASVTHVIRQLQEANLIIEGGDGESTGGRRPRYIVFNGEAQNVYIFDWTQRSLYLANLNGDVLYEERIDFEKAVHPDVFAETLLKRIEAVDSMALCDKDSVIGFGLALPGIVDSVNNSVIYSVELGWQGVYVNDLFAVRFGNDIYLERVGNATALGAYRDVLNRKTNHFQLFMIGDDGIGVSTIIHGDCQHGAGCMHGELGHIKLNSDEVCSCGQKGCLEAIVNKALKESEGEFTDAILDYIAIGISTGINISDPDAILIVGSFIPKMTENQKNYLDKAIRKRVTGKHMRQLRIYFSCDTKHSTLNGMVDYVFNKYYAVN